MRSRQRTDSAEIYGGDYLIKMVGEHSDVRVDAERYRWLRSQHWHSSPLAVVMNPKDSVKLGMRCPSMGLLDDEIDSQMEDE